METVSLFTPWASLERGFDGECEEIFMHIMSSLSRSLLLTLEKKSARWTSSARPDTKQLVQMAASRSGTERLGLQPCECPIRTWCRLKSEEAGLWNNACNTVLPKFLLGTWSRTAEPEAFASTKGFRRRIGFSPAQALHQCLPFLWHMGMVSSPLRANTGIRVSDDKSLDGNVRKWGFLQMKVFLAHSLFTADGSSGGQNPAEGDL